MWDDLEFKVEIKDEDEDQKSKVFILSTSLMLVRFIDHAESSRVETWFCECWGSLG